MGYTVAGGYSPLTPGHARIGLDNALERATTLESRRVSNGALNEDTAYPVLNVTRRDTYQTWRPTTFSPKIVAEWIEPQTVDYLAIARHNIGSAGITDGSLWVTPNGALATAYADSFDADADLGNWYRGLNSVDGTFTITDGVLRYTKGAGDGVRPRIVRAFTTVAGTRYRLRAPLPGGTSNFRRVYVSSAADGNDTFALTSLISNQSVDVSFVATGTTTYVVLRENDASSSAGVTAEVDRIRIESGMDLVADFSLDHDGPLLIPFAPTAITHAEIHFGDNANLILAVCQLGRSVIMPRPLRASMQPLWLSRQTAVTPQESAGGNILGSVKLRSGVSVSPEWNNIPLEFYNSSLRDLARDLPGQAAFLTWQPSEHPEETIYGTVTGDPDGAHIPRSTRYTFGFSMTGQAPL